MSIDTTLNVDQPLANGSEWNLRNLATHPITKYLAMSYVNDDRMLNLWFNDELQEHSFSNDFE